MRVACAASHVPPGIIMRTAKRYHAPPKRYHARVERAAEPLQYPNRQYIRPRANQKGAIHSLRILRLGEQVAPGAPGELLSG